jgi:hypothetical protein
MNQSVISFASVAARNAALPAPLEGQLVWLEDSNKYVYYSGSAWIDLLVPASSGNAIINGAFDIWQRGTSIATGAAIVYTADRFRAYRQTLASGMTVSRQDGTIGNRYAARVQRDSGNTSTATLKLQQDLETVSSLPFAGNPVTLSFYGRAGANYSSASSALSFGYVTGTGIDQSQSGGFTGGIQSSSTATLTTSWQRFSYTITPPSNATQIGIFFDSTPVGTAGANDWFEITGVQLESGSTATAFKRNANSIQGELAACQRYYFRQDALENAFSWFGLGMASSTTLAKITFSPKVTMRTKPSSVDWGGTLAAYDGVNVTNITNLTLWINNKEMVELDAAVSSGLTQFRTYTLLANNSTAAFIGLNAEL